MFTWVRDFTAGEQHAVISLRGLFVVLTILQVFHVTKGNLKETRYNNGLVGRLRSHANDAYENYRLRNKIKHVFREWLHVEV